MRIRFSAVSASIVSGAIVTAAFAQSLSSNNAQTKPRYAMWRLRLRTYDEVAATKPRSSGLTWRHFRVGHNGTHCAAARLPRRQHARRFAVASPGAAAANLSLDHLVGEREQLVGHVEAERL